MTDGQRPSSIEPQRNDSDVLRLAMLRRRSRSRALLVALLGLSALFYAIAAARFEEHRSLPNRHAGAPVDVAQAAAQLHHRRLNAQAGHGRPGTH